MTAPDPLRFDEVRDWMVNRDRSQVAAANLARFLRDNPDRLPDLWEILTRTAGRQILNAIADIEADAAPVVRTLRRGSANATARMVAAHDEMESTSTLSDGGAS